MPVKGSSTTNVSESSMVTALSSAMSESHSRKQNIRYEDAALEQELRKICSSYPGITTISFFELKDGGRKAGVDESEQMLSASMMKLPILGALFEQVDLGRVSLDETITIDSDDTVGGSGIHLSSGEKRSVRQLAELMIEESDNTAANALISLLGIDAVNKYAKSIGLSNTNLDHKFMSPSSTGRNLTSSEDIAKMLELIANEELSNAELSKLAEDFLIKQRDKEGLIQGLPDNMSLGHKTGDLENARHDGGIIFGPNGEPIAVLVVMTQGMETDQANEMFAHICETTCAALK